MFKFDQRASLGAREREDLRPDPGILPDGGGEIAFDFGQAFTMEQVAEKLGICLRQVRRHIDERNLIAVDVGCGKERRDLRVLDEDLEGFVLRRKTGLLKAAFEAPKQRPNHKPEPEPEGYAARRAARIAAKNAD